MNYAERLQNVTVLGAAGKMGSGILLLTAIEMVDLSLLPENKDKSFFLNAMDISDEALSGLMKYLKVQVQKLAEKKTVWLRKMYSDRKDLIENGEIIDQYVFDVLSVVRPVTSLEPAYKSNLIFEAVAENADLKIKIFKQIDANNPNKPWFFTNTSSVPITKLETEAELKGRILGFHFYNPPAIQKLVELILTENTAKETEEFALAYAKKLRKKIVYSNDFAGFIGNGHFMRDALYGINKALELVEKENIVKIFDKRYFVKAQVKTINAFSGHADQKELLSYLGGIKGIKKIFLVHGEEDAQKVFKEKIEIEKIADEVYIPSRGEEISL